MHKGLAILALAAWAMMAGTPPALAATDKKPAAGTAAPAAPAGTEAARPSPLARTSPMTGLGFADQPLILSDTGVFAEFLSGAARDLGRSCNSQEAYGWEIRINDQQRLDGLHNSVLGSLRKLGFNLTPNRLRAVQNDDLVSYVADRNDRRVLLVWSLSPPPQADKMAQLVLLLCDITRGKK